MTHLLISTAFVRLFSRQQAKRGCLCSRSRKFIGRHFILHSCFWHEFFEGDSLQLQHQKLLLLGLQLVVELGLHITLLRSSLRLIETQKRTNLLSTGVAGRLQSYV
ncbi:unnamed protein product [Lactuca virosa]|uniref:Uncharacterized protein n=1 Tax=Lactuca virosa TaxID=75947 RepID=A0AAU9PER8_9ASTR|nr:unnamed protein product [Lactuca virosa]